MLDPVMMRLIQQEQRQDLLREIEQERLIKAAGLRPAGLWMRLPYIEAWLGKQIVAFGLKLQPSAPKPAGCCVQYELQSCSTANGLPVNLG